jgi:hypothetical protein
MLPFLGHTNFEVPGSPLFFGYIFLMAQSEKRRGFRNVLFYPVFGHRGGQNFYHSRLGDRKLLPYSELAAGQRLFVPVLAGSPHLLSPPSTAPYRA